MTTPETLSRRAPSLSLREIGRNSPPFDNIGKIPYSRSGHRNRKSLDHSRFRRAQRRYAAATVKICRAEPKVDQSGETSRQINNLTLRLDNANRYFRRMASSVYNDEEATKLLKSMYSDVLVENKDFDFCRSGRALAKLTAANFCEIGTDDVYITEHGQRFIDSLSKS